MKQTNERLCALAQKGDAAALDSLIDNNKSFIGKVANDLFRSMNLAQSGLNLDTDDLKQAGNLGLWKAVPKFDAARGMKFLTYAAPAIRNAMMDMVRDAFAAFEQRMVTEDKDGVCYQRVSLDDVLPGEEQLRRIEAIAVQQIGLLPLGQPFQAIIQFPARFLLLHNALRLHGVGVGYGLNAP